MSGLRVVPHGAQLGTMGDRPFAIDLDIKYITLNGLQSYPSVDLDQFYKRG